MRVAWDEQIGSLTKGFHLAAKRDAGRALDCASWGALFLLAAGDPDKARKAFAI